MVARYTLETSRQLSKSSNHKDIKVLCNAIH